MATPLTPTQRALRASLAADSRWARTSRAARREHALRGQAGLLARFEAEVPPTSPTRASALSSPPRHTGPT